jgi:hypothetical protein
MLNPFIKINKYLGQFVSAIEKYGLVLGILDWEDRQFESLFDNPNRSL